MNSSITLKPSVAPPSTKDAKKALFNEYELADEELAAAKAIYDAAFAKRSGVVKKIHDAYGKGPFDFRGGVTVVIRKNNTTKQNVYFFRGRSMKELEEV